MGRALRNLHKALQKQSGANFSGAMTDIIDGIQYVIVITKETKWERV